MKILGIDPGFANVGLCVFDIETQQVDKFVYVSSKKADKKQKKSQVKDRVERLGNIADVLLNLMGDNDIKEVAVEFIFRSPSITGTSTTSLCLGATIGLAKFFILPVRSEVSTNIRKAVFGVAKIPDEVMYDLLSKHANVAQAAQGLNKTALPHCLDAYLCALWAAGLTIPYTPPPTPKVKNGKHSGKTKNSGNARVGPKNKKAGKGSSKNH